MAPLTWDSFYNVIDGKLETTKIKRCSINPATEENNPDVPISTQDDVNRAMVAAEKAFKSWAAIPYADRQKAVLRFAEGLKSEWEQFSKILTQEQGKPVKRPLPLII